MVFFIFKYVVMSAPKNRTDRQLLALTKAAKKYPKCKVKIKIIKQRRAWGDYLSK